VPGGSGQFWTNRAEAEGRPGVDDDRNGFVDDIHGWDFVSLINGSDAVPGEDWQDEDNDPNDFIGHGTGVAGLVGAISDNSTGSRARCGMCAPWRCGGVRIDATADRHVT
jgi:hypothetical protein